MIAQDTEVRVVQLEPDLPQLAEMTLRRPQDVQDVVREGRDRPRTILNLLIIGLSGIALFSVVFTFILSRAPSLLPFMDPVTPMDPRPLLTYVIGMAGTLGICLPSFYFYALLAGVRATMAQVAAISVHALARTGIVLMGLLPIYVGAILGLIVLGITDVFLYDVLLGIGVVLPFLAGLSTLPIVYRGFTDLLSTIPEARAERRAPMVRLLALAWAILYTVVAPVTLWAVRSQFEVLK